MRIGAVEFGLDAHQHVGLTGLFEHGAGIGTAQIGANHIAADGIGAIANEAGLESRFNKYFYFPDYNGEQLMTIFKSMCDKNGYALTPEAEKKAADGFDALYKNRDANFGNGRDVRNRFEDMVTAQSNRVAALEKPGKDDLMAVKPEDIEI